MRRHLYGLVAAIATSGAVAACGSSSGGSSGVAATTTPTPFPGTTPVASSTTTAPPGNTTPTNGTTAPGALPAGFDRFVTNGNVTVSVDGDFVVVETKDLPDHTSPYWGVGNASYEAPQAGMVVNPNRIGEQRVVFRLPRSPVAAARTTDTSLGAIGVALNGVLLYNQYAGVAAGGGFLPLTNELFTFDSKNGHPDQRSRYHYHVEPVWLTASSKSALVGFILDGFPIYGPQDRDGTTPSDLDASNGHVRATAEFPGGIYHYHVVPAPPYLVGSYKGTPGTVTP